MDRIKHNIQPMPEKPINKPSVESDTLKAFMYLADKSTHCETDEVLKAKFPNTSLRLLHMENQNLGIKISIQGKRATQLTLHGIALANEIRTNDSVMATTISLTEIAENSSRNFPFRISVKLIILMYTPSNHIQA